MASPVATIDIRARLDTRGLERNVQQSLSKIEKKAKFNPISSSDVKSSKMALGSMTQGADEFGKSMAAANARVLAFGASAGAIYAVGTAMKDLVSTTIDVEKRLAGINVLLKGTTGELSNFRKSLFQIAKDTGQSFSTVADSANELARQGLNTAQTLTRVKDAMVLVRLSGLDSKAAVEALTAAMNTFTAAGITSTQVVNKLANLDANFAVSTGDLAEALKRSASAASTAGVSFEELGALITTIKQKTALNAPVIGNAIKSIFVKIQRPKAMEQLHAMGIMVKEQNGTWLNSLDILKNTAKAYGGLAQSQQQQVKIMAGGLYQVNQLMAAISDLSQEYSIFDQAQAIAMKNNNSALERNAQLNMTIAALVNEVTEAFKEFGAVIGKDLAGPAMKNVLGIANKIAKVLTPEDGEGIGANLGKGLIKGLGAAISGPGLGIAIVAIGKIFIDAAKFAGVALRQVMGINDATMQQRTLQKQINDLLAANPHLIERSLSRTSSLAMVHKEILSTIQAQGVFLKQQQSMAAGVGAMAIRGGMRQNVKTGGFHASGHVPETNPHNITSERANAFAGGYKPGNIRSMGVSGKGRVTYNDAEEVKFLEGYKQPFINPPKNSRAGKKHRLSSINKTGVDPYSDRPHYEALKSGGFVPNFNLMTLFRGIEGRRASMGAPLTNMEALHGSKGVFQGRPMGKMPETPSQFKNALGDHVGDVPVQHMGQQKHFNSSGLDPFLSSTTSSGIGSTYAMRTELPYSRGFGYMGKVSLPSKDILGQKQIEAIYKQHGSLNPLYKLAETRPIGLDPKRFQGIIGEKGAKYAFGHEQEISLLMPSLFNYGAGTGTAKSKLMKLGYPGMNPNQIKGKGKMPIYGSREAMQKAYPQETPRTMSEFEKMKAQLGIAGRGFVPNFNNPLGRAVSAERMGIKQSGSSAKPMIGYDSRVGVGVYSSSQGSLGNAISQHINAGQPPSSIRKTGAAKGGVPNFFLGGGEMTGATALSFAAMGFMGMGGPSDKAEQMRTYQQDAEKNKRAAAEMTKEAQKQTKILDGLKKEATATNTQITNLNSTQEKFTRTFGQQAFRKDSVAMHRMGMAAGVDLGFSKDAKVRQMTTPQLMKLMEGSKDTKENLKLKTSERADMRKEYDARRNAQLRFSQHANAQRGALLLVGGQQVAEHDRVGAKLSEVKAQEKAALTSAKESRQQFTDRRDNIIRDPKTGKKLPMQRAHRMAAGMGRYGLGITMAAPIVAGMVGEGMFPGDSEGAKRNRAYANAAGSTGSMAGMGAMIGMAGGPKGALIGAGIGTAVGGLMGAAGVSNEYTNATGELLKVFEETKDDLNKFNTGTQQTVRAYAAYTRGLNDATGAVGAVEMQRRRQSFTRAVMQIPASERAGIMGGFGGDMEALQSRIAESGGRLRQRTEGLAGAVSLQKFTESNKSGSGMGHAESWFKRGITYLTETGINLAIQGISNIPGVDEKEHISLRTDLEKERLRLMREGFGSGEATRMAAGETFDAFDSPEGQKQLRDFSESIISTSGLADMDPDKIIKMFHDKRGKGGQAGALQSDMKRIGAPKLMIEQLKGMKPEHLNQIAIELENFGHGLKSAQQFGDLLEGISKKNRDFAMNNKVAAEEFGVAMTEVELSMRNAVKNFAKLSSGQAQLLSGRAANANELNIQRMSLGQQALSPFSSKESTVAQGHRLAMRTIGSSQRNQFNRQEDKTGIATISAIAAGIAKASTRQTATIRGLGSGAADADVERQTLLQQKTSVEQRELNRIFGTMQMSGLRGGELLSATTEQVSQSDILAESKAGKALQTEVLEQLKGLRIDSDANLALIAQKTDHQISLQTLRNEYAVRSLEIQRNLEKQGGIGELRSGPFGALKRLDDLRRGRMDAQKMGVGGGIAGGIQDFKEAEFLKNYMGVQDVPQELIDSSISSRAAQMAQAAREARSSGIRGITDEMTTVSGNIDAAEQQVQSALKQDIPQTLLDIKQKIEDANKDLIADNDKNKIRFKDALADIFGGGYGLDVRNKLDALASMQEISATGELKNRAGGKRISSEAQVKAETMAGYQLLNKASLMSSPNNRRGKALFSGEEIDKEINNMFAPDTGYQRGVAESARAKLKRGIQQQIDSYEYIMESSNVTDEQIQIFHQLNAALATIPSTVEEQSKKFHEQGKIIDELTGKIREYRTELEILSLSGPSSGGTRGVSGNPGASGPSGANNDAAWNAATSHTWYVPPSTKGTYGKTPKVWNPMGGGYSGNRNRTFDEYKNPITGAGNKAGPRPSKDEVGENWREWSLSGDGRTWLPPATQEAVNKAQEEEGQRRRRAGLVRSGEGQVSGPNSSMRSLLESMGMSTGQINQQDLTSLSQLHAQSQYQQSAMGEPVEEIVKWKQQELAVNEKLKEAIDAASKAGVSWEQRVRAITTAMKDADLEGKFRRGEMSGRDLAAAKRTVYDEQAKSGTFEVGSTGDLFRSQFAYNEMDQMRDYQKLIVETANTMKDSFKGAFHDFATGAKSSKEAFGDMAQSILTKIMTVTHDMAWDGFFGALLGPDYSDAGNKKNRSIQRRGYSDGGFVSGKKGVDKVPAMLSEGEFVINRKDAQRNAAILMAINGGQRLARGGSINSVVANQFDFFREQGVDAYGRGGTGELVDDELSSRQPTTGVMNVSDSLSQIGQEDRGINPQNRRKFARQEAMFAYNKQNHDRQKRNVKAYEAWEDEKDEMLKGAWIDAAMIVATQGMKGSKNQTVAKVGDAMASTGGQAVLGAVAGQLMGGDTGSTIKGAVAGLSTGMMTNYALPKMQEWSAAQQKENIAKQAADDAKKKMEKDRLIAQVKGAVSGENQTVTKAMSDAEESRSRGNKSWLSKLFTSRKFKEQHYNQQDWYDSNYNQALRKKANGGMIFGSNSSSDTIPAMLTEGEFVVNAHAASRNMSTLKAINGGRVKGYADGGYVTSDQMTGGGGIVGTDAGAGGLGLSDSVTELINEVRGVKNALEDQYNAQESDRQKVSATGPNVQSSGGSANVTNNISISVSVDEAGSPSTSTQSSGPTAEGGALGQDVEDQKEELERQKELSEKIKIGVVDVILAEQRPGGLLHK